MAVYDTPNLTGGLDDVLVDVSQTLPVFVPMILVFVFGVVFIGGMISQKRRTGFVDTPMWFMIASVSTLFITLIMTLVEGLMNAPTLGIVVAINVLAGIWLFMGSNRNEV